MKKRMSKRQVKQKLNQVIKEKEEIIQIIKDIDGKKEKVFNQVVEALRDVINEVAGIDVYEKRKQRALKEIKKTDKRIEEIKNLI